MPLRSFDFLESGLSGVECLAISEYVCPTATGGEEGTTLAHASEASASVPVVEQPRSDLDAKGVELDEKIFMRRVFHV